jgi:hypothetical protein
LLVQAAGVPKHVSGFFPGAVCGGAAMAVLANASAMRAAVNAAKIFFMMNLVNCMRGVVIDQPSQRAQEPRGPRTWITLPGVHARSSRESVSPLASTAVWRPHLDVVLMELARSVPHSR